MQKKRDLTISERSAICVLRNEGLSHTDLTNQYSVGRLTVARINSNVKATGILCNLLRIGRRHSTTASQDRLLHMLHRVQPPACFRAITRQFNMDQGRNISASTKHSRLMSFRLRSRVAKKTAIIFNLKSEKMANFS